ncbi:LAME_0H01112g1_1 [Lachancea meyersii CBS 8951]|uniref:Glutamyl-tRNA(Gln) amidotransferase subunit A, mitochondrial n=1 Tax=Lachancea meyersii CBS 8951 TaxID=1266667 RepID=A0A1G4KDC1_9SACH|nr:LAME_0H01112g1_1 [Lachancea meyersii CBS 8951]
MSLKNAISRLGRVPAVQKQFNVFTSLNHNAEEELKKNDLNGQEAARPLNNLLCAIKDNIATKELPTTCASKILEDYMSPYDATLVKLLKAAGAVNVGKTNLDEFGMGSGGTKSHFGPTKNPLFPGKDMIVGGSSSGSAAAVAADVVDFALGTDTGGSVRLPASYTSILGFKPSYGRISRHGVIAYAQSFDTVGIMSKEISTIQKVFKVLDKSDPKDPTCLDESSRAKLQTILPQEQRSKLRIGIPREFTPSGIPASSVKKFLSIVEQLAAQGHQFFPISLSDIKHSLPIYYTLAPAEAASNLARYDGVRYGVRDSKYDSHNDVLFAPTRENFGEEVKTRIVLGNYNLSSEFYNNHYIKAQKLRVELIDEFDSIFALPNILTGSKGNENGVDVLLSLSAISEPTSISEYETGDSRNPINSYVNDIFTTPMSLAGLPTISVPTGHSGEPVGVQIVGQYGDDDTVLNAVKDIW